MKKYFVTSDIHGYYDVLLKELKKHKFDKNNKNHILIICGDLFDRGDKALELLKFLLSLEKERLILIKGNHEDLMFECLKDLKNYKVSQTSIINGTLDTVSQLTNIPLIDLKLGIYDWKLLKNKMKDYYVLINKCIDYYEIKKYIFVHGWIPLKTDSIYYDFYKDWRNASTECWEKARWYCGIDMAHFGLLEKDKEIICGHWHTGYGHYNYLNVGKNEFDCLDVYKNNGIIALDSCVARSNKLNILIIEETQ